MRTHFGIQNIHPIPHHRIMACSYWPTWRNDLQVISTSTTEEGEPQLLVTLRLHWLQTVYIICFFVAFLIGALITFTLAAYDPETDYIYKYYNTFSPCIFFDHEPASYFSSFFVALMDFVRIVYLLLYFLILYKDASVFWTVLGALICCAGVFGDAMFLNIFSANIYTGMDEASLPPKDIPLTPKEVQRVWIHGLWYALYLAVHCVTMLFQMAAYHVVNRRPRQWTWVAVWAAAYFGLVLHTCSVFHTIVFGQKGTWSTSFQRPILVVTTALKTALWGEFGIVFENVLNDWRLGIEIALSISKVSDEETVQSYVENLNVIDPNAIFSHLFVSVACLLLVGQYLFLPRKEVSTHTFIPVAEGFRQSPGNLMMWPIDKCVLIVMFTYVL
jgi:hypothetical protein